MLRPGKLRAAQPQALELDQQRLLGVIDGREAELVEGELGRAGGGGREVGREAGGVGGESEEGA